MTSVDLNLIRPLPSAGARVSRPSRTLFMLALLAIWVVVLRWPSFVTDQSESDESLFIMIGADWLHGRLPYQQIWDVKAPGLFALFALAQWILGPGLLASRIMSATAVFATSAALGRFARRHLGGEFTPIAAALIYPVYSLILYGQRGRAEILLAPFVVTALDIAVMQWRNRTQADRTMVAVAGLLFGLAVMIKQTAVFEACLAAGLLTIRPSALRERWLDWRSLVVFACMGAIPTLGFVAYFAWSGVSPTLYLAPFVGAANRLGGDGISFVGGLLRFPPMLRPLLPLLLGALILVTERRNTEVAAYASAIRAIGLWCLAASAGIVAMRSMYEPYFLPLVPPLILATLVAVRVMLMRIATTRLRRATAIGLALVLLAYPLGWLYAVERTDAGWSDLPRKVADQLRSMGLTPADTLFVADQDTTIYRETGARIPTRFPHLQHLVCDFTLPGVDQAMEIRRIMASAPRFVVTSHHRPWMICERADRMAIVDAALAADYDHKATVTQGDEAADIYCRRGQCASP